MCLIDAYLESYMSFHLISTFISWALKKYNEKVQQTTIQQTL